MDGIWMARWLYHVQPRLVAERLERDIQLLARELVLLRAPAALDEVPWPVIKAPTLTFTSQLFWRKSPDILRRNDTTPIARRCIVITIALTKRRGSLTVH